MGRPIYCASGFVENLLMLWDNFKLAELTEVMRQQGDNVNVFVDLLNGVRVSELNAEDEHLLRSRFISKNSPDYPIEALHLLAENRPVLQHSQAMLDKLEGMSFLIPAIDEIPKNVTQRLVEDAQNRKQSETGGFALNLALKIGAKVMLTVNIDISDKLIIGQIGIVNNIAFKNGKPFKVYVKFFDNEAGLRKIASDNYAAHHKFVPIEQTEADIHINKNNLSSLAIKRTQFPLMLSWAVTVHKVQGLGVSEAVISFDLERQTKFNAGQMYVAMSRVKFLSGLHFTGSFNKIAIKADKRAFVEYERMRRHCVLSPLETLGGCSPDSLSICLLNTRSLQKHITDISCDKDLMDSDVLCLTETQLLPDHDTYAICSQLQEFRISLNSDVDKFRSIACCVKNSTLAASHEKFPGFSLLTISKQSFLDCNFTVGVFYRKHSNSLNLFLII